MASEIKEKQPGMMTLIALAITVAYVYSGIVVFGVAGKVFFWELVTLIDVMLLGHWVEMRSVMGASQALQELAHLLPSKANRITGRGDTEEVDIQELEKDDSLVVRTDAKHMRSVFDGGIRKGK